MSAADGGPACRVIARVTDVCDQRLAALEDESNQQMNDTVIAASSVGSQLLQQPASAAGRNQID